MDSLTFEIALTLVLVALILVAFLKEWAPPDIIALSSLCLVVAIVGIAYLTWFGPKLIPARTSITAELDPKSRSTKMYHVLVSNDCPLVGTRLIDSPLAAEEAGIHLVEIRRGGRRIVAQMGDIVIEKFDRYLVTLHNKKKASPESFFEKLSLEVISEIEGIVTELVIEADSSLVGQTLAQSHFRQHYNTVVLALHRDGRNITRSLATESLSPGDTLLVVTPAFNLSELKLSKDFLLTDLPADAPPVIRRDAWLSGLALIGVVTTATLSDVLNSSFPAFPKIPIHFAAMVGALLLLWTRTLTPRQAYQSIDWQVLFMLYGLLGLGMAMQTTGTAEFLANALVHTSINWVPPNALPYFLLWSVFLLTLLLTEVLSNNATAVMMIPIVVPLAIQIGVEPRPFIMATVLASSLAFALPMGYQTHLMVYGPGGFRFSDFLRVGIPLNLICWITACLLVPLIWPF